MRRLAAILLLVLAAAAALAADQAAPRVTEGILAEGTRWETAYVVSDSGVPGPTVMVVGGVHGNEPAGAAAAAQIRHWPLHRGKLVVVPRANVPALRNRSRYMPTEEDRNLNRNFPRTANEPPRGELAAALWDLTCNVKPDWLMDLHEGFDFRKTNPKTTGSSIIHVPGPVTTPQARRMLDAANATVADEDKKLVLLRNPVAGSLARSAADRLGARAFILETTFAKQPLSLRARQHRLMVHRLLTDLGMVTCGADVMVPLRRAAGEIRVALYDGGGTSGSKDRVAAALAGVKGLRLERVGPGDVLAGALDQFDVLIVPGGSGSKEAAAITPKGREAIRRFVGGGRGYVGICAGAYLAAANYSWSLAILDADVIDRKHWKRGTGTVQIELTPEGRRVLGGRAEQFGIRYANGPLLAPANRPDIPDFAALARFRSEMNKNDAPKGIMLDTPAIACGEYGRGRVLVSSPHPESTDGLAPLLHNAVRWAAKSVPADP